MSEPIRQEPQILPSDDWKSSPRDPFGLKTDSDKLNHRFGKELEKNIIRKTYERKKKIIFAEDIAERFLDLLAENVPQCGFEPPSSGKIYILDVGCGYAPEASVVIDYFSGNDFTSKDREGVSFFGIDHDEESIREVRQRSAATKPECTFILADATRLDDFPEIPKKVHVVIFRHPKITEDIKTGGIWSKMFEQARERLSDGGIAIFTTFMKEEQEMLADKLNQLGYEIIIKKENERAIPIPDAPKGANDGYIVIARASKE